MNSRKLTLIALALAFASATQAADAPKAKLPADMKPKEILEAREGLMLLQKMQRGAINAVVKGEAKMSDATVQAAVDLANLARMLPQVFPAGSGKEAVKTAAKPEIWQKPDEFKARYEKLQRETTKLVDVAKTKDVNKLKDQLKQVADACNACHDQFREDEDEKPGKKK